MTASLNIIADENIPDVAAHFAHIGHVRLINGRKIDRHCVKQADILLVRSITQVNKTLLEGSAVQFVGSATIGTDHLDTAYLNEHNINWANAPGSNAQSVVDYVLSAFCRIDGLLEKLLAGTANSRVGIVGMGNVGSRLYQCLDRLNIPCVAYDPLISQDKYPVLTDLKTVLAADVICFHTPITTTGDFPSYHMISPEMIQGLPKGAVLISAGRGGVINQQGLTNTLAERPDLQLVFDVWENEPAIDSALLSALVLATPHIAGYSLDGKLAGVKMIAQACSESLKINMPATAIKTNEAIMPVTIKLKNTNVLTEGLREAILSVYDIAEDDCRLREALRTNTPRKPDDIAAAFDTLRRDYPVRRELSSCRIENAKVLGEPLKKALGHLGFLLND